MAQTRAMVSSAQGGSSGLPVAAADHFLSVAEARTLIKLLKYHDNTVQTLHDPTRNLRNICDYNPKNIYHNKTHRYPIHAKEVATPSLSSTNHSDSHNNVIIINNNHPIVRNR